jgi:hypothetical protein
MISSAVLFFFDYCEIGTKPLLYDIRRRGKRRWCMRAAANGKDWFDKGQAFGMSTLEMLLKPSTQDTLG